MDIPLEIMLKFIPLGFGFHPTDDELVDHFLMAKINGHNPIPDVIPEFEVYKSEPWDLPDKSVVKSNRKWFFFSPRDHKHPDRMRSNQETEKGYWKAMGKDQMIRSRSGLVGMKKTLVFHLGRAPKGERTSWMMHEYWIVDREVGKQGAFVLCQLFKHKEENLEVNQDEHDDQEENGFLLTPMGSPSPQNMDTDLEFNAIFSERTHLVDKQDFRQTLASKVEKTLDCERIKENYESHKSTTIDAKNDFMV